MKNLKFVLIYSTVVAAVSAGYFIYALNVHPPSPERETFLSEIGEGLGEIALWALVFVYARTALKLCIAKGSPAERLIPEEYLGLTQPAVKRLLRFLNRTHVYVGVATVAVILLHIALVGLPMEILFFPAVLALVVWQGLFGAFLTWRYSPRQLKKFSYLVHAQFITGIAIGIFAYFGHILVDD